MGLRIRWFIGGIFCFLLASDAFRVITDGPGKSKLNALESYLIMPGVGLWVPLTGRCVLKESAIYFECNRAQATLSDLIYE